MGDWTLGGPGYAGAAASGSLKAVRQNLPWLRVKKTLSATI
jgi:hypothetical protein